MLNLFWLLLAFIVVLILMLGLSFYMTRRQRLAEMHSPAEFDLPFEEVIVNTPDGLALRAWWIPATGSDRAVIILHGYGGSMDYDVQRAPPLHLDGFNVLLFDFRAHGRSQGKITTFGYLERYDVQGAVKFLKDRGIGHIGLLGFSLGGIVAILSAPICPEIAAIIEDGSPARQLTAFVVYGTEKGLPRWLSYLLAWLAIVGSSMRLRVNLFRYEPVRWVGKITPRPILFIHGEQDQYRPDFDDLYAAAFEPKEAWRVPEAGHTTVSQLFPEEYQRKVLVFFEQYLK